MIHQYALVQLIGRSFFPFSDRWSEHCFNLLPHSAKQKDFTKNNRMHIGYEKHYATGNCIAIHTTHMRCNNVSSVVMQSAICRVLIIQIGTIALLLIITDQNRILLGKKDLLTQLLVYTIEIDNKFNAYNKMNCNR